MENTNPFRNLKFNKLKSASYFRLKIIYSLLMNKPVEIAEIRATPNDINPGLLKSEISFLKLILMITNGTFYEISKTGTILKFKPGIITNNYGEEFEFETDPSRGLTYYLEGLLLIAMFGKESLNCRLTGITNNDVDNSVDTFRSSTCSLIQKLVVGDTIKLDILKRGVLPSGKGEVKFKCPIITFIEPIEWLEVGKIKKIRGVAFTSKISPNITNRIVDACRGVFNNFIPDVWINTDNYKSKQEM